jgi:tetratricopeptide (TPR) repeat protein
LGEVYLDLAEFDRAERCLARARAAAFANPVRWATIAYLTARQRQQTGQYRSSLSWATRGIRVLANDDSADARHICARLSEHYAHTLFALGRHRAAIRWADRAIDAAKAAGLDRLQSMALEIRLLSASALGQPVDHAVAAESVRILEQAGDLEGLARAHNVWGLLALASGDWDVALEQYAQAADACDRVGRPLDAALQRGNQAEIFISQRRLDEAQALLEDAMSVWRGADATRILAFGQTQQGRIALARGEFARARELFDQARRVLDACGEHDEVAAVDALIAQCLLSAGQPADAIELLTRLSDKAPALDRVRGAALVAQGRVDEGMGYLRDSLENARQRRSRYEEALTLEALLAATEANGTSERAHWDADFTRLADGLGMVTARSTLGRPAVTAAGC